MTTQQEFEHQGWHKSDPPYLSYFSDDYGLEIPYLQGDYILYPSSHLDRCRITKEGDKNFMWETALVNEQDLVAINKALYLHYIQD
jgi:hypothetical protein